MLSIYNQKGEKYQMKIYKSFFEITNLLQDETQCREYLEQARWGRRTCLSSLPLSILKALSIEDQRRIQRSV